MKFASINENFFNLCKNYEADDELLFNTNRRPYLIIMRLAYKSEHRLFALPFRSDISGTTPKEQYYSLPPRPNTKPGRRHGLHYIKIFPIEKSFLEKFRVDNDPYYTLIKNIICKNESKIIKSCQEYLVTYEKEGRQPFSPDIDKILYALTKNGEYNNKPTDK